MSTDGIGAGVLRLVGDRYFHFHEPPERLPRRRLAIAPPVLVPDRSDGGAWRASDKSGIRRPDAFLVKLSLSRICPLQRSRPERVPWGSASENGHGIDFLGNDNSTDCYDLSGLRLFLPGKRGRSKSLSRCDIDSVSLGLRYQPQHIRVPA